MTKRHVVCGLLFIVAGCAQVDGADKDKEWVDRVYRTGSNIPARGSPQADGVQVMNKKDVEDWQLQRPPALIPHTPDGSGGH